LEIKLKNLRHLYQSSRHLLLEFLAKRLTQPSRTAPRAKGLPVVAGFLSTPSGLGNSARLCYAALVRLGQSPLHCDLSQRYLPFDLMPHQLEPVADPWVGNGPLILHVNPPELPSVAWYLGRRATKNRLVIGYWAWELEKIPQSWDRGFSFVHEVWTPSEFCARAIRARTDKPVRVVPHPLYAPDVTPPNRKRFDIPQESFVVLSVCDLRSSVERKNPIASIEAFKLAFENNQQQILVLKLGGLRGNEDQYRAIESAISGTDNIRIVTESLSEPTMSCLIASVDCILSLHRSEGFGLVLAEGLLAGKVVISSDWSGSRDFIDGSVAFPIPVSLVPVADPQNRYQVESDECWADPDIVAAAETLRQLATSPQFCDEVGKRARNHALAYFGDLHYASTLGEPFRRSGSGPT